MNLNALLDGMTRVLNEGASTTSYKWLLLWSIMDSAPRQLVLHQGRELNMSVVSSSALKVIEPQLRDYPSLGRALRQGSQKQDPVLYRLEKRDVVDVAWALTQWPLARLQRVPTGLVEVLWTQQPTWEKQLRKDRNSRIPKTLFRVNTEGEPVVDLLEGSLEGLLRLSPLVKPLIELRWRNDVRAWNKSVWHQDPDWSLDDYLFPDSNRQTVSPAARRAVGQLHGDRCFWCDSLLVGKKRHLDHVVPWSRSLNNSVENLVVTDQRCNLKKADHLLSRHLGTKWARHVNSHRGELSRIAETYNLPYAPEDSLAWLISLARSTGGEIDFFDVAESRPVLRRSSMLKEWPVDFRWISA